MFCFLISVSVHCFDLLFFTFHEQRIQPFEKRYQYLLFAAEPYEIISFKVYLIIYEMVDILYIVRFRKFTGPERFNFFLGP